MAKAALIILDGWGINPNPKVSAITAANTPTMDRLMSKYPNATLTTFGEEVGLPEGQMGNSEVGHMNLGAGRIVYQELARINKAVRDGELLNNKIWNGAIAHAQAGNKRIHLMGLVSDGGVHSHIQHLLGLCAILKDFPDIEVYIHAFTDGRDTDPKSGKIFLQQVEDNIKGSNIYLATVTGRYYAMDRDKRWGRVKIAYDALVNGSGEPSEDFASSLDKRYANGETDEFILPIYNANLTPKSRCIHDDDVVIFFNFRTDRPRQLTEVLTQSDMPDEGMRKLHLYFVSMTNYDHTFNDIHVIFEKDNLSYTMGEIIAKHGKSQVRIAETEKYPHVTFFFNGGNEKVFENEERILIPSPKVATYDLKPEMSAVEITNALIPFVEANSPDFICLNYANTDMVGHTGIFSAAVQAAETVDSCLGRLLDVLLLHDYKAIILADHGNSDIMINPDGSPNTAHTTNPVPVILVGKDITMENSKIKNGKLGDIAPTLLELMHIPIPSQMTGNNLVENIA
ncbi:MAG: 2,3-bisphosphoglycerate-independent phosphoglycerate mutase [Lewinellaceae bacterium]|nr:2,3-bisphosphoglycerate-independent phosphoglycerate mutase [Lewinellaceae bacterium]